MHKLINVEESAMTRVVELKNMDTNQIDRCFDDSALKSDLNFEVMEKGLEYNCKILLLGDIVHEKEESVVMCSIINSGVYIGKTDVVEIDINSNRYYVMKKSIREALAQNKFLFKIFRKDLVEVDDIVHKDLL